MPCKYCCSAKSHRGIDYAKYYGGGGGGWHWPLGEKMRKEDLWGINENRRKLHKNGLKGLKIESFWVIHPNNFCGGGGSSAPLPQLCMSGEKMDLKGGGEMIEMHNIYPCSKILLTFCLFYKYNKIISYFSIFPYKISWELNYLYHEILYKVSLRYLSSAWSNFDFLGAWLNSLNSLKSGYTYPNTRLHRATPCYTGMMQQWFTENSYHRQELVLFCICSVTQYVIYLEYIYDYIVIFTI